MIPDPHVRGDGDVRKIHVLPTWAVRDTLAVGGITVAKRSSGSPACAMIGWRRAYFVGLPMPLTNRQSRSVEAAASGPSTSTPRWRCATAPVVVEEPMQSNRGPLRHSGRNTVSRMSRQVPGARMTTCAGRVTARKPQQRGADREAGSRTAASAATTRSGRHRSLGVQRKEDASSSELRCSAASSRLPRPRGYAVCRASHHPPPLAMPSSAGSA